MNREQNMEEGWSQGLKGDKKVHFMSQESNSQTVGALRTRQTYFTENGYQSTENSNNFQAMYTYQGSDENSFDMKLEHGKMKSSNGRRQSKKQKWQMDFNKKAQTRKSQFLGVRCEFIKQVNINHMNVQRQKERQFNHKQITNPENNFRLKCIYGKNKKEKKQLNYQMMASHLQKNKILSKIKMNEEMNKDWERNLKDEGIQDMVQELINENRGNKMVEESRDSRESQIQVVQTNMFDKNYKRNKRTNFITQENEQEESHFTSTNICDFITNYQNHHFTKTHKYKTEISQEEYSGPKSPKKQSKHDIKIPNIDENNRNFNRELLTPSHFEAKFVDFIKNVNNVRKMGLKRAKTKMFAEKMYREQTQSILSKIKDLKQKYNYDYLDMNDRQLLYHRRKMQYSQLNLDKKYDFFEGQTDQKYYDISKVVYQLVNRIENYKKINDMYVNENQSEFKVNKDLYNYVRSNMTISEMDNIMDLLLKDMADMGLSKKKGNAKKDDKRENQVPKQRIVDNVLKMIEDMEL